MKITSIISTLSVALIVSLLAGSVANAQDPNKMTYEKAMRSQRSSTQEYRDQSITPAESQAAWDNHRQKPEINDGSGGGGLKELWKGHSQSLHNSWGLGTYYVEMSFNKSNLGGGVWITVDNATLKKSVSVASPFNYEANWYVQYESSTFKAMGNGHGSTKPTIIRVSRIPSIITTPTPHPKQCTPSQSQSRFLGRGQGHCPTRRAPVWCEGKGKRTCSATGSWGAWVAIGHPICVARGQRCP